MRKYNSNLDFILLSTHTIYFRPRTKYIKGSLVLLCVCVCQSKEVIYLTTRCLLYTTYMMHSFEFSSHSVKHKKRGENTRNTSFFLLLYGEPWPVANCLINCYIFHDCLPNEAIKNWTAPKPLWQHSTKNKFTATI